MQSNFKETPAHTAYGHSQNGPDSNNEFSESALARAQFGAKPAGVNSYDPHLPIQRSVRITDVYVPNLVQLDDITDLVRITGRARNQETCVADQCKVAAGIPTNGILSAESEESILSQFRRASSVSQLLLIEERTRETIAPPPTPDIDSNNEFDWSGTPRIDRALLDTHGNSEASPIREKIQILGQLKNVAFMRSDDPNSQPKARYGDDVDQILYDRLAAYLKFAPDDHTSVVSYAGINPEIKDLTGSSRALYYRALTNVAMVELICTGHRYAIATCRDGNTAFRAHKEVGWIPAPLDPIPYHGSFLKLLYIDLTKWTPCKLPNDFNLPVILEKEEDAKNDRCLVRMYGNSKDIYNTAL